MSRIGVWGLVFLVLALIVSVYQILSYRAALQNSAQFIGIFPNNMNGINDLVADTSFKLVGVADFCPYGFFSNPPGYETYKKALLDIKQRGGRVELHVYEAKKFREMAASQFNLSDPNTAPQNFITLKNSLRFKQYFEYWKEHNDSQSVPETYLEFLDFMDHKQAACLNEMQSAGIAAYGDIKTELPMFMWIRDDSEEAIVSIYNTGSDSRELSQRTKNKQFILLLKDIEAKLSQVH